MVESRRCPSGRLQRHAALDRCCGKRIHLTSRVSYPQRVRLSKTASAWHCSTAIRRLDVRNERNTGHLTGSQAVAITLDKVIEQTPIIEALWNHIITYRQV